MEQYSDINLKCSHCGKRFDAASSLLLHFAKHMRQSDKTVFTGELHGAKFVNTNPDGRNSLAIRKDNFILDRDNGAKSNYSEDISCTRNGASTVIFLPVSMKKVRTNKFNNQESADDSVQENEDSNSRDFSDDFNPLKFCSIQMDENAGPQSFRKILPKKKEQCLSNVMDMNSLTPKKKYTCHLCHKVFGWSTDLKRHILIHTGEKPYKCPHCKAAFTRNFLLQKHLLKIHPCRPVRMNDSLQKQVDDNIAHLKHCIQVQ